MKNLLYISLLFILTFNQAKAQQIPNSSLYNINPFHNNSAYAGFNDRTEAFLSYRSQWTGINSAPSTVFFSMHSALPKNIGLGANIAYDQTDIISRFAGTLTYSYRIKFKQEGHTLGFGLSLGLHQININPQNAIVGDITDEVIANGTQSGVSFNNDFSILYSIKKFEFGFSIPQIIESKVRYDLVDRDGSFGFKRHYIGYAAYDLKLSEKFSMQPSVVYRSLGFAQNQVDINTQFTYNNIVHLGAGYRTNQSMIARFGINIKDHVQVAYAYDVDFRNIGSYSNGSHEIMLGFMFGNKKKNAKNQVDEFENKKAMIPESPLVQEKIEKPIEEAVPVNVEEPAVVVNEKDEVVNEPLSKEEEKEKINKKVFEVHIHFLLGSTKTDENFDQELDDIAKELKAHPETQIIIIGHSCDIGTVMVKEKIAIERALMVKKVLIEKGVNAANISTLGKSDKEPLVPNTSEANRKENRRVEFILK